jgi:hypothetical protein
MASPMLATSNPRILSFYEKNATLDFETVNLSIIDFYENLGSRETMHDLKTTVLSLKDLVTAQTTPSRSSSPVQSDINIVLNSIYPSSFVIKQKQYEKANIFLMKRPCQQSILISSENSYTNCSAEEIDTFNKCVEDIHCNGIFISHYSGVSMKSNYQIDYVHGNIIVFIHHAEYNPEKIKVAIDIIDHISCKLKEMSPSHGEATIPKSVLDDINKEYQLFLSQKEALISIYKECQKKVLSQIDELRFPQLDKYLSTKFIAQPMKQGFKCDLCKSFNANNLKALAAHKRGCARKNVLCVASAPTIR